MNADSRPKWQRLGRLLAERRARIDPRYTVRKTFASEVSVHPAVLRDIETTARDNYTPPILAAVEVAYRLMPGAIQRFINSEDAFELEVDDTPPGGFETVAEWPALRVGGSSTATLVHAATARRTPRWFASEVDRRGWDLERLTLSQLQDLAQHFKYSLAELLLHTGLASDDDLEIEERPASPPESEALANFDAAMDRVVASPFLSKRQREDAEAFKARVREEAIKNNRGNV